MLKWIKKNQLIYLLLTFANLKYINLMKKILSVSALAMSVFALCQTGIKFEDTNFKSTLEKAKKENKLVFLDAYTTWCGPCKLMAKNIFPLQSVGDYYNANFVNAKLDMEKGEGLEIAKKYGVKAFPTYLFIDGNGNEVHRTLGYVEEKAFIKFGQDAQDPSKRMSSLIKKFEAGEKDPAFLKNLAELTIYSDPALAGKIISKYFEVKGSELTKEDMNLLMAGLQTGDDAVYKIFTAKKTEISNIISAPQYDRINKSLQLSKISKKAYNSTTKKLDEALFLAETEKILGKEEAQKTLNSFKGNIALKNKDFVTYQKMMMEKYKDFSNAGSEELNEVAWNFFEKITDKKALETAITWAQASVQKNENFANTDTLANLYNKIGDKKNAKIWAEKSIELGKKAGEDVTDTQKLLDGLK